MCKRTDERLDAWHTVVTCSLVGDDRWEETRRVEVCSWACLRLAYMAPEPDEPDPEACSRPGSSSDGLHREAHRVASDALLTARAVAELLDVHPETILRWTRRGQLRAVRLPSGALRYRPDELDAWLDEHATRDEMPGEP